MDKKCTNTCYFTAICCFLVGRQGGLHVTIHARTPAISHAQPGWLGSALSAAFCRTDVAETASYFTVCTIKAAVISHLFVVFSSANKERNEEQELYDHLLFHSYSLLFGRPTQGATMNKKCTTSRAQQSTKNVRIPAISQPLAVL